MSEKRIFSNSFSEITDNGDLSWCDGMVSGNGVQGVIISCAPYSDSLIYQNINFIMPSDQPRHTPKEVSGELFEARQAVINMDDTWDVHGRNRTFDYCFHPSHQLRISIEAKQYTDYIRWTDFETAEIGVKYSDPDGIWIRKTFVSREDDVVITSIKKSSLGKGVSLKISIDDISTMRGYGRGSERELQIEKKVYEDTLDILQFAKYPIFPESELNGGGYCGFTHVICEGGEKNVKESSIYIKDADAVYLITKSDRSFNLKKDDLIKRLMNDVHMVAEKYTENGLFRYNNALEPSKKLQKEMFERVSLKLADNMDIPNEKLIDIQNNSDKLIPEMVERVYNQGRYAMICCAGNTMSRLCGMWTGEWNCGWNGIYTMDANVNLQSAAMNTGNLLEFGIGYINFILRQIDDWKENAHMVYNMEDALLVPVNFDGNRAMMVEYDWMFPFQYWNAGASWMLQPIYEMYQCFGDMYIDTCFGKKKLLRDILLPLLTMQANFWKQIVTPEYYMSVSKEACYTKGKTELLSGEKYLIIPSYSPENNPKGRKSRLTANATMDIAAARDGLLMTIKVEKSVRKDGYNERISELKELMDNLPDYMFDESGALREWSAPGFLDNHEHRHISHMYPAWPAFETQYDAVLEKACKQAIINRNEGNDGHDDFSSHGWLHRALVCARLKDSEMFGEMVYRIIKSNIFYKSLMTDHNTTGRFVYCTDTSLGILGVINEGLLYSDDKVIELLPGFPVRGLERGSVRGLRTRCRIKINELTWDMENKQIVVILCSDKHQTITLRCLINGLKEAEVYLRKGKDKKIVLNI